MSVLLADIVVATGRKPTHVVQRGFGLAAITAGRLRECEQGVQRSPLPDEPAHADVFGKKSKAIKRRLAKGARWIISPSEVHRAR